MICKTCDYKYVLNAGDCGACPLHCLKCTESKDGLTCTQCKNRTVMLSDGTCERKYRQPNWAGLRFSRFT